MEKRSLQSWLESCLTCLSLCFMEESLSSCEIFEKILRSLISYEQSPSRKADVAKLEFSNFLSTAVKNKDFFVNFDKEPNRIDTSIFS